MPPTKRQITAREQRKIRTEAKRRFDYAEKVERRYAQRLRAVARQVNHLVHGMTEGEVQSHTPLVEALRRYSEAIKPWASAVSSKMADDIARHDANAWRGLAGELGTTLRAEQLSGKALEVVLREITQKQVEAITTLPLRAAERVRELAVQGVFTGQRASVIRDKLRGAGRSTLAQANTIARTATSSAASAVVQARSTMLGSESYVWRSAEDNDVRKLHRKLNGKVFYWNKPPVIGENGERGNPGEIYNCRCYPEPILPD